MQSKWDRIKVGITLGMIAPLMLLTAYWKINYSYMDLDKFTHFMEQGQLHTKLISLCVIINLVVFFIFIWRNLNLSARGVLYATFIYTFIIAIYKFLV